MCLTLARVVSQYGGRLGGRISFSPKGIVSRTRGRGRRDADLANQQTLGDFDDGM